MPSRSEKAVLMRAVTPEAASRCPTLGLAEPSVIDFRVSSLAFGGQVYPIEGAVTSAPLERARSQPASAGATTGTAGTPAAGAECLASGARIPVTLRNALRLRA